MALFPGLICFDGSRQEGSWIEEDGRLTDDIGRAWKQTGLTWTGSNIIENDDVNDLWQPHGLTYNLSKRIELE